MKVLIIEDEIPAAEKLGFFLKKYDSEIEIMEILTNIKDSVEWFKKCEIKPELIFLDIQLSDGKSFEIFNQIKIQTPIIFTTAYDNFALEAFRLNSIDYLLKPLDYDKFVSAMEKIKSMQANLPESKQQLQLEELTLALSQFQKSFKTRFMVKVGEHIKSINSKDIAMFYADEGAVFLQNFESKKYIIDYKMENLEEILDPEMFFRVNRTYIVNISAISDVIVYSNSRLKIKPCFNFDKEIIVSREKVQLIKTWFNGLE